MSKKRVKKRHAELKKVIEQVLDEKFKSILHDISYRLSVLIDEAANTGGVTSGRLNLAVHLLDGYVFTDNSPSAGYVSWSDCHIVYKGQVYKIQDGNTNKKYIWWDFDANPNNVFQVSDTKPDLTDDDVLVAINDNGKHTLVIGQGRMTHGAALLDATVRSSELADGAVTTTKIASRAITSTLLADGAVTSTKIASGAVTTTALANNAVDANKLADNAVTSTKIANGAVTSTKIGSGAVTSTAIASGAVQGTHIADGAVTGTKIASGVVSTTHIASGAVGSKQLADGAVTATKIGAGAVAADKLNLAQHLIF